MKFEIGDQTDTKLRQVLTHEFLKCESALENFNIVRAKLRHGKIDLRTQHAAYDSHSRFIHSLYEFFTGTYKRDNKRTDVAGKNQIEKAENIGKYISMQLGKILSNISSKRMDYGFTETEISSFPANVPCEFPSDFRNIRNKTNGHVDYSRATVDLYDFYNKYNNLLLALYSSCEWWWGESDQGLPNLGFISSFAINLSENT